MPGLILSAQDNSSSALNNITLIVGVIKCAGRDNLHINATVIAMATREVVLQQQVNVASTTNTTFTLERILPAAEYNCSISIVRGSQLLGEAMNISCGNSGTLLLF